MHKQYVAVWEQRHGDWQWACVCLLTGGGRHLGNALLRARWQRSPPAECVCIYATLLKGQKLELELAVKKIWTAFLQMHLTITAFVCICSSVTYQIQNREVCAGHPNRKKHATFFNFILSFQNNWRQKQNIQQHMLHCEHKSFKIYI